MKQFTRLLFFAFTLFYGCSQNPMLTPDQFTTEYAQALKAASPDLKIAVKTYLELNVTLPDGREITCFLNNAYDSYKQNPAEKTNVFQTFIPAHLETIKTPSKHEVDRGRIVPLVKDRPWLEETRHALLGQGAKKTFEMVYEDLNPDLIILYAEDAKKNMRYLSPEDLKAAKLERAQLRSLACENLKKIIPPIQRIGTNGFYMVSAGGDYEASLLLMDWMWDEKTFQVRGEIVIAIPNRDILIVTGSGYREGLAKLQEIAKKSFHEGSYRLTPQLFVRRNGTFVEFSE